MRKIRRLRQHRNSLESVEPKRSCDGRTCRLASSACRLCTSCSVARRLASWSSRMANNSSRSSTATSSLSSRACLSASSCSRELRHTRKQILSPSPQPALPPFPNVPQSGMTPDQTRHYVYNNNKPPLSPSKGGCCWCSSAICFDEVPPTCRLHLGRPASPGARHR